MKVLMLGWEFPPFISGGLGTACYGLTKALSQLGTEITFLLPRPAESQFSSHLKLVGPGHGCTSGDACDPSGLDNVTLHSLNVKMYPYGRPGEKALPVGQMALQGQIDETKFANYAHAKGALETADDPSIPKNSFADNYGSDMYDQILRYSNLACQIARKEPFDVIHAHDWMTYPAGVALERMTGKPLVVHVHSTEFDRSGEHVNQWIYDLERQGMHCADQVIAVSNLTSGICRDRYGIPSAKLRVVYNGVQETLGDSVIAPVKKDKAEKIVLFLGRITMQKGPEYFVAAAKKVLEKMDDVKFIMAGSGDMFIRTVELAAEMGIGHKILFAGFLQGRDVDRVFQMADLYVMPSVSEPFGISPLEAMTNDVPVIISKQSGVAEILDHALKVDFWDIDEMANKIVSVLRRPALRETLRKNGADQVRSFQWIDSARQCREIYNASIDQVA